MTAAKHDIKTWIPAANRLPEKDERVLLFTPYRVLGDDQFCIGNRESITDCVTCINRRRVHVFTHWMPLPPNPDGGAA